MALNPQVIIDLAGPLTQDDGRVVAAQWNSLGPVDAVQRGRVHVITQRHALRPGHRYIAFMDELARLLHPGAFADGAAP